MREQFEKLPEIRDSISEHIVFIGNKYTTPNPDFYDLVNWLNGAWYAWQAKAQAVQEGFVLVPKEMPKSFDEGLYVYSNSISIVDECSEGFIPMSDINHAEVWKLVIEAQEQSK